MKRLLCYALLILFAGCARIADPRPPEHHVPEVVTDINARQVGEEIVLTFSLPERNTDGSPARTIRSLEIFRITEKAGAEIQESFDDLSEEQFLDRAAHIFSIPAERFPEYTRENIFTLRDSPSVATSESIYSPRFRYAAVFVNEKKQAAGLGRQAVVQPMVLPPAPEILSAVVTENDISITWTSPSENLGNADIWRNFKIAYNVYRSENPHEFPAAPVNDTPLSASEYRDSDFQFDKNYYYAVRVVSESNPTAEGALSEILKVETRDVFPPAPPVNFTTIDETGRVTLFWTPSPSEDVAGYRIFRRNRTETRNESRRLLRESLITGISYRDEDITPDGDYIYEIQAVDAHGNASEIVRSAD